MATLRYLHYDVFTDEVLAGNQLAVFPEAAGLSAEQMQRIAREMNFSETTFVLPPTVAAADVRVRIFTPGREVPMAGHPTIGTAFALAEEGSIAPAHDTVTFELGIGPVPIRLEWQGERLATAWMRQAGISSHAWPGDREAVARALGIAASDIAAELPIESGTAGLAFLFVPLVSRAAVDRTVIDSAGLQALARLSGEDLPLFIFSTEPGDPAADVYSRMFAPQFGIAEDPATGSASGPLALYLARHGLLSVDIERTIVSLQGHAMGRPARISVHLAGDATTKLTVEVGGSAVLAGRAELYV